MNKTTKLLIEAKTKGMATAQRETEKVNKALSGAEKAVEGYADLNDAVDRTTKAMRGLGGVLKRGLDDWRSNIRALREYEKGLDKLAAKGKQRGADGRSQKGGGGGGGGKATGRMIGAGAVGYMMGRGNNQAQGALFGGAGGLSQALNGIPIVGGLMAGQLNTILGFAGAEMGARTQQAGMLGISNTSAAVARVARLRNSPFKMSDKERKKAAAEALIYANVEEQKVRDQFMASGRDNMSAWDQKTVDSTSSAMFKHAYKNRYAENKENTRLGRIDSARRSGTNFFATAGKDLGIYGPTAGRQFGSDLTTASGGFTDQYRSGEGRRFLRDAMAASTVRNIAPQTAGGFMRGQLQGGLEGTTARKSFENSMATAIALKIEGSDLSSYMAEVAASLSNIDKTGIAINPASVGKMAMRFRSQGFTGARSVNLATQMGGSAQNLGAFGGISNAAQALALMDLGGFHPGGSLDDLADARQRMEKMDFVPGGMSKLLNRPNIGGSGKANAMFRQGMLRDLDVNVPLSESIRMGGPESASAIAKMEAEIASGTGNVKTAKALADRAKMSQGSMDYTKENLGALAVAQTFERGQLAVTKEAARLNDEVQKLSKTLSTTGVGLATNMVDGLEKIVLILESYLGSP